MLYCAAPYRTFLAVCVKIAFFRLAAKAAYIRLGELPFGGGILFYQLLFELCIVIDRGTVDGTAPAVKAAIRRMLVICNGIFKVNFIFPIIHY